MNYFNTGLVTNQYHFASFLHSLTLDLLIPINYNSQSAPSASPWITVKGVTRVLSLSCYHPVFFLLQFSSPSHNGNFSMWDKPPSLHESVHFVINILCTLHMSQLKMFIFV